MSLSLQLTHGLAAMGLQVSDVTTSRLLGYVAMLKKWNQTYNLTAIRDEADMVTHHVLDSLSILPALQAEKFSFPKRWADIGSGAGLPGIPLAIMFPELDFTLIDAVDKKSAFQRQAKIELHLTNVSVISDRVESQPDSCFDMVIARAFADLSEFVRLAGHLAVAGGKLLAMKGVLSSDELGRVPSGWCVSASPQLNIPGVDAQRHLIILERS